MNRTSFFTVKCFQVLLYHSHNLISVICLHTRHSIRPKERIILRATNPGQIGFGSNCSEGVLHFPKILKGWSLPLNGLIPYPEHLGEGVILLCRDSIRVFYSPSYQVINIRISLVWKNIILLRFIFKLSELKCNVVQKLVISTITY